MASLVSICKAIQAVNTFKRTSATPKCKYKVKYMYGIRSYIAKPAYVYYLKFVLPSGQEIYKIGYTSTSMRTRISFMNVPKDITCTLVSRYKCVNIPQAWHVEQYLHEKYVKDRYYGSFLASGNTELYVRDVLGIG